MNHGLPVSRLPVVNRWGTNAGDSGYPFRSKILSCFRVHSYHNVPLHSVYKIYLNGHLAGRSSERSEARTAGQATSRQATWWCRIRNRDAGAHMDRRGPRTANCFKAAGTKYIQVHCKIFGNTRKAIQKPLEASSANTMLAARPERFSREERKLAIGDNFR